MVDGSQDQTGWTATDRLEALAALAGGFAHDFNNMLTVIRGAAELMERAPAAEAETQRQAIVQTADRAAVLTHQLMAFARRQPLRPEAVDLGPLLGRVRDEVAAGVDPALRIRVLLPADLPPARVDAAALADALHEAASNARDAMPEGGVLTFAAARIAGPDGDQIKLSVADSGAGMTAELVARAFEPFFTTKVVGAGSGLGLAGIHGFAAQSGGRASLESAPGRGTTLTLFLPLAECLPVAAVEPAFAAPETGTRVLLVEDSNTVAAFAEALLTDMGCLVTRAACASEALDCLSGSEERFDIMFSDIVMPGMSGIDLAARVRDSHPRLPILLATGHSEQVVTAGSAFPILPKPYRRDSLARMMGSVMAA